MSVTEPSSQLSSPAMQLSSVDLPTPDSPMMATNSPGATSSVTWLNTVLVAYRLARFFKDNVVVVVMGAFFW